jgi:uncharacterized protein YjbJ (UPF0337 family)
LIGFPTVYRGKIMEGAMNWDRIEGSWKQFGGKAKSQWGALTDDDSLPSRAGKTS